MYEQMKKYHFSKPQLNFDTNSLYKYFRFKVWLGTTVREYFRVQLKLALNAMRFIVFLRLICSFYKIFFFPQLSLAACQETLNVISIPVFF